MRTLDRRYRLERCIGVGGMSAVWHGHDILLGRPVAVKLLGDKLPSDVTQTDRASHELMRVEAQATARLTHPNVVNVYDFGRSGFGPLRRVSYLVMELLDGETLATCLDREPLDWRTAAQICADVAAGLSAAHAHGIVHRDVKPANVMLTSTGVKVVDFGIAAAIGHSDAEASGQLVGTPAYVAPERLRGEIAVPGTDVYGLGLLLYHCLTGRLPWSVSSSDDLITAHLDIDPQPLPPIPGLPPDINDLCMRCLRKQPQDRPEARSVALALARAAGTRVSVPNRRMVRSAASSSPDDRPTKTLTGAASARHRPTWRPMAVAGMAMLALFAVTAAGLPGRFTAHFGKKTGSLVALGGGAMAAPVTPGCAVTYAVHPGPANDFTATLTIGTPANDSPRDWTLTFTFPAEQSLVGANGAQWTQIGHDVTLQGQRPPGSTNTVTVEFDGTSTVSADQPSTFVFNGRICELQAVQQPPSTSSSAAATGGVRHPGRTRVPANRGPSIGPSKTPTQSSPSSTPSVAPSTSSPPSGAPSSSGAPPSPSDLPIGNSPPSLLSVAPQI
jgi:eukaryotic-like serine/threonine-protein kinase